MYCQWHGGSAESKGGRGVALPAPPRLKAVIRCDKRFDTHLAQNRVLEAKKGVFGCLWIR